MLRLLILDNDEEQRTAIKASVRQAQYDGESVEAATREEAWRLIESVEFDLAIIDLHLGDSLEDTGIDIIRDLHRRQPNCKIIALSIRRDNQPGIRAMAYGAADYVSGRWPWINWKSLLTQKVSLFMGLIGYERQSPLGPKD